MTRLAIQTGFDGNKDGSLKSWRDGSIWIQLPILLTSDYMCVDQCFIQISCRVCFKYSQDVDSLSCMMCNSLLIFSYLYTCWLEFHIRLSSLRIPEWILRNFIDFDAGCCGNRSLFSYQSAAGHCQETDPFLVLCYDRSHMALFIHICCVTTFWSGQIRSGRIFNQL